VNLTAKPIIKNQYWVVTDGEKKVGNVIHEGSDYKVILENTKEVYTNTKEIEKSKKIVFEKVEKTKTSTVPAFAVYPTSNNRTYNNYYDVKRKLHIFTKTPKSKCYYVAGWFAVKQNEEFIPVLCPKYIFIQRYDYLGPFMTKEEVNSSINSI